MSTSTSGALRLAEDYVVRGRLQEAVGIYQRVVETEPLNVAAKARLAELFGLSGQTPAALDLFSEVITAYEVSGQIQQGIASAKQALRLAPTNPDLLFQLGNLCTQSGLIEEAEVRYLQAAELYSRKQDGAKVQQVYEHAAAVAPDNPQLQLKFGALCHRTGRLESGYLAFMRAADEFSRRGDQEAALDAYGRALKIAPSKSQAEKAAKEVMKSLDSSGDLPSAPANGSHRAAPVQSEAAVPGPAVTRRMDRPNVVAPAPATAFLGDSGKAAKSDLAATFFGEALAIDAPANGHSEEPTPGLAAKGPGMMTNHNPEAPARNGAATRQVESGDEEETLIGKISKAEILFGFGSFDDAIAILDNLLQTYPDELRVHQKLKDIYLRSEMPEKAAEVCLELARIYEARGENEMAAHSHASARRLANVAPEYLGPRGTGSLAPRPGSTKPLAQPKRPPVNDVQPPPQVSRPAAPAVNQTTPSARSTQEPRQEQVSTGPAQVQSHQTPAREQAATPAKIQTPPAPQPVQVQSPAPEQAVQMPPARVPSPSPDQPARPPAKVTAAPPLTSKITLVPGPSLPIDLARQPERAFKDDPTLGSATTSSSGPINAGPINGVLVDAVLPKTDRASGRVEPAPKRQKPKEAAKAATPRILESPAALSELEPIDLDAGATVEPAGAASVKPGVVRPEAARELQSGSQDSELELGDLAAAEATQAAAAAAEPARKKVSKGTLLGVSMDTAPLTAPTAAKSSSKGLVAAAAAVLVIAGVVGGYFVMRSRNAKVAASTQVAAVQPEVSPAPIAVAQPSPPEVMESSTSEAEAKTIDRPADTGLTPQQQKEQRLQQEKEEAERPRQIQTESSPQAQAQAQVEREAQTRPISSPANSPEQTRAAMPAPPSMNTIGASPANGSGGSGIVSGSIGKGNVQAPPPPPTANTPQRARSTGVIYGEITRRVQPAYPQAAKTTHQAGSVSVEVSIDEGGNVVSAHVVSGAAIFASAAQSAARGFKFKPTTLDGKAIRTSRTITFNFKE